MKSLSCSVQIDDPCKQNWDLMTPQEGGSFCSECSKTVTDFTILSDAEIVAVLQRANGRVCGRFNAGQLNRELITPRSKPRQRFVAIYKFLAGLLMVSAAGNTWAARKKLPAETVVSPEEKLPVVEAARESVRNVIRGRVIDSVNHEPVINAAIVVKNLPGLITDLKGYFEFVVPDSLEMQVVSFSCMSLGYYSKVVSIDRGSLPINIEVQMQQKDEQKLGEIRIVTKRIKPKKRWQFWK